jgi:glycogen operon protein
VRLAGDLIGDVDERGEVIRGDTLLLLLNAHHEPIPFRLPQTLPEHRWELLFDTADLQAPVALYDGGQVYPLHDRSLSVLRTTTANPAQPALVVASEPAGRSAEPIGLPGPVPAAEVVAKVTQQPVPGTPLKRV